MNIYARYSCVVNIIIKGENMKPFLLNKEKENFVHSSFLCNTVL
jgi:hypothetical protein